MRRSRLEIYVDILKVVSEGTEKPTRIMYRANLSWPRLQEYLDSLIRQGLLVEEERGERRRYRGTEKGFRVLRYFRAVKRELPSLSVIR